MADEEEQKDVPVEGPPPPPPPAPVPVAAGAPPSNKLHEWGAAALLMMILAGILYTFLNFIRGSGL